MQPSRRPRAAAVPRVSLKETLVTAGLDPDLAQLLEDMPHRVVHVDPKRPFRDPGAPRYCRRNGRRWRREIIAVRISLVFCAPALSPTLIAFVARKLSITAQ